MLPTIYWIAAVLLILIEYAVIRSLIAECNKQRAIAEARFIALDVQRKRWDRLYRIVGEVTSGKTRLLTLDEQVKEIP